MWLTEGENRIILENKDKNTVRLAAGKASEKTQGTLNRRENLFSLRHILKEFADSMIANKGVYGVTT